MIILFCSAFLLVFCYGPQAQFVNGGFYSSVFWNSLAISACNLLLLKLAPLASSIDEVAGYLLVGPIAIVLSMFVFRRFIRPLDKREAARFAMLEADIAALKARTNLGENK
jgi:hypothetical protein